MDFSLSLSMARLYKEPWPDSEIFAYVRENSATHFYPQIIDLFFVYLEELIAIRETHRDNLPLVKS
ncbi:MAG: hypothetical protein MUP09_00295 [Thiovulaceae bacterium]|nr:hypothetical protein [Sulfurimonadaceae bacterium]